MTMQIGGRKTESIPGNRRHPVLIAINASPASKRMRFSVHGGRSTTITSRIMYVLFVVLRHEDELLSRPLFRDRIFFLRRDFENFRQPPVSKINFCFQSWERYPGYTLNYRLSEPVTWKKIDIKLPREGNTATQISMLNLECERGGGD